MKKTAIILAAGNQTRFPIGIPKCLVKYKNDHLIRKIVSRMNPFFDRILIVLNSNYSHTWKSLIFSVLFGFKKCCFCEVKSGDGINNTLRRVFKEFDHLITDHVTVHWSDSITEKRVYYFLSVQEDLVNRGILVPLRKEENPYMAFKVEDGSIKAVKKFGPYEYHDLSVFSGSKDVWKKILNETDENFVLHLDKFGIPVIFKDVELFSFNTINELLEVKT